MFEKKLTPQHHWLSILPILIIMTVVGLTLGTSVNTGVQPRETFFDLFMRLDPRDVNSDDGFTPAIVMIDEESIERVGPWPWPRTALAELVGSVRQAGARAVVITVPVEGPDPLSPEVVGQYWFNRQGPTSGAVAEAVARLPSNDVSLGNALSTIPSAVAIAPEAYAELSSGQAWIRTEAVSSPWLNLEIEEGASTDFLALPLSRPQGQLASNIAANARSSVSALPADSDGTVRRVPLAWNAYGTPMPSTALASVILQDGTATAVPHRSVVRSSGRTFTQMIIDGETIALDRQNAATLYLPSDVSIPTISAWRVLSGSDSWTSALQGNVVFIGENVNASSIVETARGEMSKTQVHALMADQLADGVSLNRPEWAGFLEAGLALLLGVGAVICALVLAPVLAASYTLVLSIAMFILSWVIFSNSSMLIDPSPAISAMIGGQIGVVLSRLAGSVLRDDAVRGAFHGALPPSTMAKLQRGRAAHLLDGTRRQVTVLSCNVRLPDAIRAEFLKDPAAYMAFKAQTNDRLRQTILNLGGTVDYGEDGRLLGYWNVPEEEADHIEDACSCALQMIEDINQLAEDTELAQSVRPARLLGKEIPSPFGQGRLEVGISSDVCFSGPVGRGNRNRYSVIGPAVAFANLLRNRSRLYGPAIICDETVFTALRHHFAFLDLDVLKVNDDTTPRPVYGLVGNPFLKASKAFRNMSDTQRALVVSWREGSIAAAEAYLKQLEELPGTHEAYVGLFRERIEHARKEGATEVKAPLWDGSQQVYL
ncbi:CHASE2 domain-containing protein [Parvularcula flava]|uniref:CHASE2 domain-containing protein n=1 Tax=Aquisalinus luteolus TaxID=1566827 RepID=A0A8J3A7N2_9PROT|nr:CHASE2 domain-containing protein [Aquisalinus luteolus]NHK27826.1 CHASE2 domain-containing protein [Aquisalinus luteolus]GGH96624.1 guanylate cyclase [Aquisalinus luteolus]